MFKVLLIEEESPQVRLLAWALREEGKCEVLTGAGLSDAEAAVAVVPDFIVFNTNMKVIDKRRWIESLRYLVPDVRIIDLHPPSPTDESLDTGADAYIQEPYVESLLSTVRNLAAQMTANQGQTS